MKRIISFVSIVCVLLLMVGCGPSNTSMAYTFTVDNGDKIDVKLNTTDGHELSSDVPFEVSYNGEPQSQGTFILADAYDQYVGAVEGDENATLLDSGTKDGNEYIFWSYNGVEFNYAIRIANSNTGILLGNIVSEESAKECFDRLTISVTD